MKDQLSIFEPMNCEDTGNAISSPASAFGLTPYAGPDGRMPSRSGRVPVHVNHSAMPAAGASGLQTFAICGRLGFDISPSAGLNDCLLNKLRPMMDSHGSTLFALTWKERITPSGRLIYALRASGRHTSGNAYSFWATPMSRDHKDASAIGSAPTNAILSRQVWLLDAPTDIGVMPSGCRARTAKRGRLNPAFTRWLQGLPPAYCECAVTAMQSMRKRPRRLSAPQ
jgi:hypothetical protein